MPAYYVISGKYRVKLHAHNAEEAAINSIKRFMDGYRKPTEELSIIMGVNEQGFDVKENNRKCIAYPTDEVAYMAGFPDIFGFEEKNKFEKEYEDLHNDIFGDDDLPW